MKYETLKIFRPCISQNITQGWGENRACLDANGRVYGVPKGKTCIGPSFYQSIGLKGHNGADIAGLRGQDIYHAATFDGWLKTERDSRGGIGADVVSYEPLFFARPIPPELINSAVPHEQDGVQGFTHYVKMRYWHLDATVGHDGKKITCGTVVGLMGNTGASSGTHLHFSPKWCLKDGRGVGQSNGYYGAFDHTPYYDHDVTALFHAESLKRPIMPLSKEEQKDVLEKLSRAQVLLLALQKLINKI